MTDKHPDHDQNLSEQASPEESGTDDLNRRDLLAEFGRFAYAAPALALLTRPKLAQADYGGARKKGGGRYSEG